jgi:predicted peptidase
LGGYGVLDLIAADPARFAAAVIIAAGGRAADARRYAAVPTWFLHGERDEIIPVEQPRRLVSAIRRSMVVYSPQLTRTAALSIVKASASSNSRLKVLANERL